MSTIKLKFKAPKIRRPVQKKPNTVMKSKKDAHFCNSPKFQQFDNFLGIVVFSYKEEE